MQPGTSLQEALHMKPGFPEPRLIVFVNKNDKQDAQGFVVAEETILFEVDSFCVVDGIVSLLSSYYAFYIKYPKSVVALSFLLFVQEILLGKDDISVRRTSKYASFVNSILTEWLLCTYKYRNVHTETISIQFLL